MIADRYDTIDCVYWRISDEGYSASTLRHRLYDAWLVVGGTVDPPAHRVGLHSL
jgi:hypothetical protein